MFNKLGDAIQNFLQKIFGSMEKDPKLSARQMIQKQKRSHLRLKDSLTDLIFQRKKFEAQLTSLENKRLGMKEDIDMAAFRDRDDLAIRLMEEMDLLISEMTETKENIDLIRNEIETAKQVELELARQIEKSESQLAILHSRSQSVKMREDLQKHFTQIHQEISHLKPNLNDVEENILRLEARLENLQGPNENWKKEVVKMRKERTDHFRKARLQQLKIQLKSRQLPGKVIVPELVEQAH
jgi:phage shock protein A